MCIADVKEACAFKDLIDNADCEMKIKSRDTQDMIAEGTGTLTLCPEGASRLSQEKAAVRMHVIQTPKKVREGKEAFSPFLIEAVP